MRKLMYSILMAIGVLLSFTGCEDGTASLTSFDVTFDSQGGSSVTSQSIAKGEKISRP